MPFIRGGLDGIGNGGGASGHLTLIKKQKYELAKPDWFGTDDCGSKQGARETAPASRF